MTVSALFRRKGAITKGTPRVVVKKEQQLKDAENLRKVHKHVDARERLKCVACRGPADPQALDLTRRGHRHHITFRSKGGYDTVENLCLVCAVCHAAIHAHTLAIKGNAEEALEIWRLDDVGEWFMALRRFADGRVEHD